METEYQTRVGASQPTNTGLAAYYPQKDVFVEAVKILDKVTPRDIYFEKMEYDAGKQQLVLSGIALAQGKLTSIPKFVERLNASPYFNTVISSQVQESGVYTVPAFSFRLTCTLTEESKK